MKKFLFPTKDTTIYQALDTQNTGLDEILEIGKVVDSTLIEPGYATSSARILLNFNLSEASDAPVGAKYYLNLRLANAREVWRNQEILVYPVSRSWAEGSGYFYQDIENVDDGATWLQSERLVSWSLQGSDFLTGSTSASVILSTYPIEDIRIDVTNILNPIVVSSSTFHGLLLKFPAADENNEDNKGVVQVFSSQTHTIHRPTLEVGWVSQTFTTASLSPTPNLNVAIITDNLRENYTKGDVARINFTVRDKYPARNFDGTLRYRAKYYLPTSSYYSITDIQSNTLIVPFDSHSKIECDSSGVYLTLDTEHLYRGRFYTLKAKIVSGSYSSVMDIGTAFKIV